MIQNVTQKYAQKTHKYEKRIEQLEKLLSDKAKVTSIPPASPPQSPTSDIEQENNHSAIVNSPSTPSSNSTESLLQQLLSNPKDMELPEYDSLDKNTWIKKVINRMSGFPSMHCLLNADRTGLTSQVPPHAAPMDTLLYTKIESVLTKRQMAWYSGDVKDSSGVAILHTMLAQIKITKDPNTTGKIWQELRSICRHKNESLEQYIDRAVLMAKQLEGT